MRQRPKYSIVVPMFNEADNVVPLVRAVRDTIDRIGEWELLVIDDGSTDATGTLADALAAADPRVHVLHLARNYGQTPALQAGFDRASGDVVITMDGDLQNDPEDIPRLIAKLDEGYDLVTGYRVRRKDNFILRTVPSRIANRIIRWITGVSIRDTGCSLKAFRKVILDRMHLYSDMHRFIPVVAATTAGARVVEIPVRHRPRLYGDSKYGLSRVWKVLVDLMVIAMIRSFRERPLVLFAGWSIATAMLGIVSFGIAAIVYLSGGAPPENTLVWPGTGLVWMGLAVYLLMLGLIAEAALAGTRRQSSELLPVVHEAQL
ncbi:MAG: glycosyltransferase family 2 protein [Gemmatimonadales bacterium]|jgi:glycosyltransferase involved in cell wall biosynthesis